MNNPKRVPVIEAARQIGCSPNKVREKMKRGRWKLGIVEPPEKGGRSTYEFFIYQHLIDEFLKTTH